MYLFPFITSAQYQPCCCTVSHDVLLNLVVWLDFECFDIIETLLATLPVSEGFNLITNSERCWLELDLATGSVCLTDINKNPNDWLTLPFGIYIRVQLFYKRNNTPHQSRLLHFNILSRSSWYLPSAYIVWLVREYISFSPIFENGLCVAFSK